MHMTSNAMGFAAWFLQHICVTCSWWLYKKRYKHATRNLYVVCAGDLEELLGWPPADYDGGCSHYSIWTAMFWAMRQVLRATGSIGNLSCFSCFEACICSTCVCCWSMWVFLMRMHVQLPSFGTSCLLRHWLIIISSRIRVDCAHAWWEGYWYDCQWKCRWSKSTDSKIAHSMAAIQLPSIQSFCLRSFPWITSSLGSNFWCTA